MSSTSGGTEGLVGIQTGGSSRQIIDALVATRQARVDELAKKQIDLRNRVGIYGKIQGVVNELKTVASGLSMSSSLGQLAAVSSAKNLMEGIVTGTPQQGAFSVHVDSVAAASRYYSDAISSASQTGILQEGMLTIQAGSERATFTIDGDTSLEDIRDRINSAQLGVNAAIAQSKNAYTLVVTGVKTGEANRVNVSETPLDGDTSAGGARLNFGNHVASVAKDTVVKVDGQATEYRSASQTVEGAIPGVSIKVTKEAEQQDMELRLETNPESVKAQLEQFVQAYNRLMHMLYEATKKEPATPTRKNPFSGEGEEDPDDWYNFHLDGTQTPSDKKVISPDRYKLSGDKQVGRLMEELQRLMADPLGRPISGSWAPSHVGMVAARDETGRLRRDGSITIDDEKLRKAVLSDYDGVVKIFTADPVRGTSGLFGKIKTVLESYSYNPVTRMGPLDSGTENMRYEIDRTRKEMESRQESVDSYRKVLTAQFVELEKFMAKHKAQGDYLNAVAAAVNKR